MFTNSVLALRPKTGEVVCYYQYTPNDVYDVDATDEQLLADIRVGGQLLVEEASEARTDREWHRRNSILSPVG